MSCMITLILITLKKLRKMDVDLRLNYRPQEKKKECVVCGCEIGWGKYCEKCIGEMWEYSKADEEAMLADQLKQQEDERR